MKKIKLNECQNSECIKEIKAGLENGKIFVFPTSTLYGIGCSIFCEDSIKKVYEIKKRPNNKPLIVLASNLNMVRSITQNISETEEKLMSEFWPGGLTLILEKSSVIPDIITSGSDYVGVRIDENSTIRKIIEETNTPIVAPSANISGEPSVTKSEDLNSKILESTDYLIDGGQILKGTCSTIVKCENGNIKILREGKISKDELIMKGFSVIY